MSIEPSPSEGPAPVRFQFSLRTLLLLPVPVAAACSLLFVARPVVAAIGLVIIGLVLPPMLTTGIIFGRGYARAFCIGALFPLASLLLPIVFYIAAVGASLASSFADSSAEQGFRWIFGASWLVAILTGALCVWVRWWVQAKPAASDTVHITRGRSRLRIAGVAALVVAVILVGPVLGWFYHHYGFALDGETAEATDVVDPASSSAVVPAPPSVPPTAPATYYTTGGYATTSGPYGSASGYSSPPYASAPAVYAPGFAPAGAPGPYIIETPDVLEIVLAKPVPLPSYRAEVFDVLEIRAAGAPAELPLGGNFLIESEGTVNLGPAYGSVRVAGMTVDEMKKAVEGHLQKAIPRPKVTLRIARAAVAPPIRGQHMVGPGGTVALRHYGAVPVAGRTLPDAQKAIREHLAGFVESPEATVRISGHHSKAFYVVTRRPPEGDDVRRVDWTGSETVSDAVKGLDVRQATVSVERVTDSRAAITVRLPVAWDEISRGKKDTDHALAPGDRVLVEWR